MVLLLTLFTSLTLTAALPNPHPHHDRPRAGGPIAKPLPSTCHTASVAPSLNPASTSFQTTAAANGSVVYSYFLEPDTTFNVTECVEQCYGFGDPGDCVAVFVARQALTPVGYFGTAGGARADACLMFARDLTAVDFEAPEVAGTYLEAQGLNIECCE